MIRFLPVFIEIRDGVKDAYPHLVCAGRDFLAAFQSGDRHAKLLRGGPRRMGEERVSSRASIRSTFPRMVLISPVCRMKRLGCARSQEGVVFVEKRECTIAIAEMNSSD